MRQLHLAPIGLSTPFGLSEKVILLNLLITLFPLKKLRLLLVLPPSLLAEHLVVSPVKLLLLPSPLTILPVALLLLIKTRSVDIRLLRVKSLPPLLKQAPTVLLETLTSGLSSPPAVRQDLTLLLKLVTERLSDLSARPKVLLLLHDLVHIVPLLLTLLRAIPIPLPPVLRLTIPLATSELRSLRLHRLMRCLRSLLSSTLLLPMAVVVLLLPTAKKTVVVVLTAIISFKT